jgi:LysM repeat protein
MLQTMTAVDAGAQLVELSPRPAGCPFLVAEAGGWRLDSPSRDHRCGAFSPAAPLAPEKQSRLCLTDNHLTCATYLASVAARQERLGAPPPDRATRWGLARTTTVIEDPGGVRTRVTSAVLDRRRWPAIPAVLLVTGLFILAMSGFRGFLPTTGVAASPSAPPPTVLVTASPRPTPPPPTPSAPPPTATAPAATPTAGPTEPPTNTPKPTFRTYTVKPGDTLSAIAARYHTTVSAIAALNHITDPSRLSVGQVLLIPN